MKTKDEIMQLSGRDLDAAVMMSRNIFYDGYIPRYSTDIAITWKLVEWLQERPFDEMIQFADALAEMFDATQDDYHADIYNVLVNINPEAISRAFLLAMAGD